MTGAAYAIDPNWVQPSDCTCVLRHGVWWISKVCAWHGLDAPPEMLRMKQPIIRVAPESE